MWVRPHGHMGPTQNYAQTKLRINFIQQGNYNQAQQTKDIQAKQRDEPMSLS